MINLKKDEILLYGPQTILGIQKLLTNETNSYKNSFNTCNENDKNNKFYKHILLNTRILSKRPNYP